MISVFSSSYFPSIHYLRALCESKNPLIDIGEHCEKQTERTRATILSSNGIQKLTIPVIRPFGNKTATKDVQISFVEPWQRNHCRAIETAYAAAPYYEDYANVIFELINSKKNKLAQFNEMILEEIISLLELPISPKTSTEYIENQINDFRNFDFNYICMPYIQVDFSKNEFYENLSILDALFCLGPMARKLITH